MNILREALVDTKLREAGAKQSHDNKQSSQTRKGEKRVNGKCADGSLSDRDGIELYVEVYIREGKEGIMGIAHMH